MFEKIKNIWDKVRYHSAKTKEWYDDKWEESLFTRILSICFIVFAIGFISWYGLNSWFNSSASIVSEVQTSGVKENVYLHSSAPEITNSTTQVNTQTYSKGTETTFSLINDIDKTILNSGNSSAINKAIDLQEKLYLADPHTLFIDNQIQLSSLNRELILIFDEIRTIRNYAFIDTQKLMLESPDREATLENFLYNLQKHKAEATDSFNQINIFLTKMNDLYKTQDALKTQAGNNITQGITSLDPKIVYDNLEQMIGNQSMASEAYSTMRLFQRLNSMYQFLIKSLDLKITVIAANREALIKGVSVVNVKGMEEKLILTEKEWVDSMKKAE